MLDYLTSGWGLQFLRAIGTSLTVAALSFVFCILIGILCTLLSRNDFRGSASLVNLYTYVFRSLPDILLLILIFYSLDGAIQSLLNRLPGSSDIRLNAYVPAIMSTSIVLGAYATELFKAGWADIPKGQFEAGQALGFTRVQSLVLVILPQVYRKIIPHLGSLSLISMKETALLSVIGIPDIVRTASIGARSTGSPFVFYGIAIAIFVIFAILCSRVFAYLESRARAGAQ
ncbi:ABC transporter permease subunit [Notoacmeibacter sp. MSK16QG-6]|uniref:ABC transporter permease subunit n=1 Tax=Notoacmeibacter sp. MSK16QG-6 TaxID=2957982 RepID=UPI0020A066B2|nr:ABC transporter permease subunit [Notoacmeibacter sp. MSK16QG-6]MCP1200536.1 ABC transporter permease subunit [Notoacmeibacter sp. MSK16QG-6]